MEKGGWEMEVFGIGYKKECCPEKSLQFSKAIVPKCQFF